MRAVRGNRRGLPLFSAHRAAPNRHNPIPAIPRADASTPPLPSGTLTFLVTDIEGSTRLWQGAPAAIQIALARHDVILRQRIETHGGHYAREVRMNGRVRSNAGLGRHGFGGAGLSEEW